MGLSIRNLEKRLGSFHLTLDLVVRDGELLSILGPSGCGKTTSLRLVAGIEELDSGEILMGGRDITHLPAYEREVGMVFQNNALFPHMNVYRNIAYGPKSKKRKQEDIEITVTELLELTGLSGFEKRKIHQLSGGEQQRVALARALATDPRLLLFDEPLSSLDIQLKIRLRKEIRRIQQSLGITSLYVTHDQEEALAISDRIAVMRDGKIEQTGTPEELYRYPATSFVASFIGRSNLMDARITGKEGKMYLLETPAGVVSVERKGGETVPGIGDSGTLFFRPDAAVLKAEDGKAGSVGGTIKELEYQGNGYIAEVGIGGATIFVEVPLRHEFRAGQRVAIAVKSKECRYFPDS